MVAKNKVLDVKLYALNGFLSVSPGTAFYGDCFGDIEGIKWCKAKDCRSCMIKL